MTDAIPAPLDLVAAFVNTKDVYQDVDDFDSPAALRGWLRERGLLAPEAEPSAADLDHARAVREALRMLLLANNAGAVDAESLATLNRAAADVPMVLRFEPDGTALVSAVSDVRGAVGTILAAVHHGMAEGTWDRLKACRSEDCEWIFYDRSRNHSARWCTMKVCGNRNKARRFRARQTVEA